MAKGSKNGALEDMDSGLGPGQDGFTGIPDRVSVWSEGPVVEPQVGTPGSDLDDVPPHGWGGRKDR